MEMAKHFASLTLLSQIFRKVSAERLPYHDTESLSLASKVSMQADSSFADLMARLHRGDQSTAADIFDRYSSRLVRLAAPRLVGMIRQKVDAEDLVQSAFKSFFRANAQASSRSTDGPTYDRC